MWIRPFLQVLVPFLDGLCASQSAIRRPEPAFETSLLGAYRPKPKLDDCAGDLVSAALFLSSALEGRCRGSGVAFGAGVSESCLSGPLLLSVSVLKILLAFLGPD